MRAMILAAGRGERMRPLTDHTPKPLLEVGGKPLIVWHIQALVAAGIRDIVINHAWLGDKIVARLGDGRAHGARLAYSAETQALETAGGIRQALDFFDGEPFLVINGDVWCDWSPARAEPIAQALEDSRHLGWILLTDNPLHHPDGDFSIADNGHAFAPEDGNAHRYTFTGIGVYRPELFQDIEPGRACKLGPLLREAMAHGHILASHHNGEWSDIGTPQRLTALDARLRLPPSAIETKCV